MKPSVITAIALVLLALVFVVLKMAGAISWSWLVVLCPLYGPLVILLGILLCILVLEALHIVIIGLYGFVANIFAGANGKLDK